MKEQIDFYIREIKNGNVRYFDELYLSASKVLFFCALGILKNRSEAEEIMQDTFVKVLQNMEDFDEEKCALNWMITVCKNLAINRYRRRNFAAQTTPTSEACVPPEDHSLIDFAMRNLSRTEFEVLTLCEIQGFKRREVAQMLEMPIPTVTWHYREALRKLKKRLKEENERCD